MKNHAIADALEQAGYNTTRDEFNVACFDALRRSSRNAPRAADMMRDALIKYLVALARDMDGKPLSGGQTATDAHRTTATTERPTDSGGRGHERPDAQAWLAPTPATSRDGDKGQLPTDTQSDRAPPSQPHRDGAGPTSSDAHPLRARSAREPSVPKRGLAAMGEATKKLYADFHIGSVGMAIGDVRVSSYERLIFAAGREKVLGRCLKAYVARQAHVAADAKTRDIVPEELIGRMIAFSKHTSLHGIEYMNDTVLLDQMEAFDGK